MEGSKLGEDQNPLPDLPQEIIIEILSRLPVKSLLKFRCVCKSWLSLISASQFMKTHLRKSREYSKNYANHTLILGFSSPVSYYTCSVHSLLYDTSPANPVKFDLPNGSPWIIGSCNGLLCVSVLSVYPSYAVHPCTLILCNPSLKKLKTVPFSGAYGRYRSYAHGFGHDELNDDYKVAQLCCLIDDVTFDTEVRIYSLRNDSWRRIKNYPGQPVFERGASVCGKLNWLAYTFNGASDRVILTLDMAKEECDQVRMFEYENGAVNWSLMESGGCLCACGEYYMLRVDVWVMKEYGVEETWTRLVSVPYFVGYPRCSIRPLFVSNNGEILLNYKDCVMLYKSRDGTFETREMHGVRARRLWVEATPYFESLVPPCFDGLS